MLVTSGIWRPLRLVGFRTARLTDVQIRQEHDNSGAVGLNVTVTAETIAPDAALIACARVTFQGQVVAEAHANLTKGAARLSLRIADPQLWWPNGMGGQPLYNVVVELRQSDVTLVDVTSRRIGLRTLRLDRHPDQWGESFQFVVNGTPFFAKGANWIPSDTFVTRMTWDDYAALIGAAAAANMNMLRVWGGGIYEQDAFYDLCDEYGICLWQDFMFACATYPTFDEAFMANVREEAIQNVRRLRHHASLALWCGNNELEQGLVGEAWNESQMSWKDYGKLFDKLLPEIIQAEDPDHDYWPCSPHTPQPGDRKNHNDPTRGDAHLWDVWHGRKPFEWYRTCEHRFNSEFGFQSFPDPLTVREYTEPSDRNVTTYVMEKHQRSGIGNAVIMQYLLDWFRLPTVFNSTLCLTQILQGMAIKYAVEHWRRSMPRGMGTLYWQLNDCWPVASWASLDYYKRWKALHYMARDFYAPLLISGLENLQQGTVEIHVTSDRMTDTCGDAGWILTDLSGRRLAGGHIRGTFPARTSQLVTTVNVKRFLDKYGARGLLFWLDLTEKRQPVSRNLLLFARPKHLDLPDPEIRATVKRSSDAWMVTLTARHPALWAWVQLDSLPAVYSNNYLHLRAGEPVVIEVKPEKLLTAAEFKRRLKVSSLVDTYQDPTVYA